MLLEATLAFLVLTGSFFLLIGALGLLKLPDLYMRLHAPTKSSTLGVGSLLIASMLAAWSRGDPGVHELLITLFVFLTAPVSANLIAMAALHLDVARRDTSQPPLE